MFFFVKDFFAKIITLEGQDVVFPQIAYYSHTIHFMVYLPTFTLINQ